MSSAMLMLRAATAAQVVKSNDPNTPGAGQHDAPSMSLSSMSRFSIIILVAFSIPGYRLFIIHPKKYANAILGSSCFYSISPVSQLYPINLSNLVVFNIVLTSSNASGNSWVVGGNSLNPTLFLNALVAAFIGTPCPVLIT